jgi:alpha-amylase
MSLLVDTDIANLLWCHQNLHFKDGAYFVPWQAPDALVIEREAKALIGVTDNWTQWQNLTGVQTHWADGTILIDYSGANGSATRTVYGGGKVDISIPPCDGTANLGRRGYCVWAPQGISTNYQRPAKTVTQEWEMSNDLGDAHTSSLQQGGRLPDNSLDCRVVGRIYAQVGVPFTVELYPELANLGLQLTILDKDCTPVDSITVTGNGVLTYAPVYSGWHTIRVRNASATQMGQKCWVKAIYQAPKVVQSNAMKKKCACSITNGGNSSTEELLEAAFELFPNPSQGKFEMVWSSGISVQAVEVIDLSGRSIQRFAGPFFNDSANFDLSEIEKGSYVLRVITDQGMVLKKIQVN